MPFARPTRAEIIAATEGELVARLGIDKPLRRSSLAILARVVAGQAHLAHAHIVEQSLDFFPQTGAREVVERWGQFRQVQPKDAVRAKGDVVFTGTNGTTIPQATRLRRSDGEEFETTASAEIASGTATVEAQALVAGDAGNTPASTTLVLVSPIAGIDSEALTNAVDGLSGGDDLESLEVLRARVLQAYREPLQGGAKSDYVKWAGDVDEVTRAFCIPLGGGLGTVHVTFLVDDHPSSPIPDAAKVAEVQAYIDELRPVTADVLVFAPVVVNVDPDISVTPDTQAIRDGIEANLEGFLRSYAEPGKTIPLSKLNEYISTVPGVESHVLNSPIADVTAAAGEIVDVGTVSYS